MKEFAQECRATIVEQEGVVTLSHRALSHPTRHLDPPVKQVVAGPSFWTAKPEAREATQLAWSRGLVSPAMPVWEGPAHWNPLRGQC